MFDDDELERLRGADERSRDYLSRRKEQATSSYNSRFMVTFAASLLVLVLFVAGFTYVGLVPAATVGEVGGFYLEADKVRGEELRIYPAVGETSACPADFEGQPGPNDQAIGLLGAEIGSASIPAESNLSLTKDIKVPPITNIDVVRVKLARSNVPASPNYPDTTDPSVYPDSYGYPDDNVYVQSASMGGLSAISGDDEGYLDFTDYRTDPQVPGTSPGQELTVNSHGFFDYSNPSLVEYVGTRGVNPDVYVDDVEFAGLSNLNTGDNGGYNAYLANNTDNMSTGSTYTINVGVNADFPDYSSPNPSNYGDLPLGNDSTKYISDVTLASLSRSSGDDGGYIDVTGQNTGNLTRGDTPTISVGVDRTSRPSFTTADPANYGGDPTANDCVWGLFSDRYVYFDYIDLQPNVSASGPGCGSGYHDWTEDSTYINTVVPGRQYQFCVDAYNNGGQDYHLGPTTMWIDWEQNNDFTDLGNRINMGAVGNNDVATLCSNVRVPADAEPGTTMIRLMIVSNDVSPPGPRYDGSNDDGIQVLDLTLHVAQVSQVAAYFDWNNDRAFQEQNSTVYLGRRIDRGQAGMGSYTFSQDFTVPSSAYSGSGLMRVVHREDAAVMSPFPTGFEGEVEDYAVHVEPESTNYVRAFFDWDRDPGFDNTVDVGSQTFTGTGDFSETLSFSTDVTVPSGAEPGANLMRVIHKQGPPGGYAPEAGEDYYLGEAEDYITHVEPYEQSEVRAWIDWDQNGDFSTATEYDLGSASFPENHGSFTRSANISVPSGVPEGVTLMRIIHKQGGAAPTPTETNYKGETEDYTVYVNNSGIEEAGLDYNLTLGDVAMKGSVANASRLESTTTVATEQYTTGSADNPYYGPEGDLSISAKEAYIEDFAIRAHNIHILNFILFDMLFEVEYNPTNPRVKNQDVCQALN